MQDLNASKPASVLAVAQVVRSRVGYRGKGEVFPWEAAPSEEPSQKLASLNEGRRGGCVQYSGNPGRSRFTREFHKRRDAYTLWCAPSARGKGDLVHEYYFIYSTPQLYTSSSPTKLRFYS